MKTLFLYTSLFVASVGNVSAAHEVWIEPLQWQVQQSDVVLANIRNGEYFSGFNLSWNDEQTVRSEAWVRGDMFQITGRLGDLPALKIQAEKDGLLVFLHQSDHRTVNYNDFGKFASFLTEKGYDRILNEHAKRGLTETRVKEAYSRFSKSLIAVGTGEGSDAPRGLELELVALTNPYMLAPDEHMIVQLYYEGAPLSDNKITVFGRTEDGTVDELFLQTDTEGKASFPTSEGMTYLVDSVVVREPSRSLVAKTRGAAWESLWASLTFSTSSDQ